MAINLLCCETVTTAQFDKKCLPTPRKGGIPYVGYINCSIEFEDIKVLEDWELAIAGNAVGLFPEGIGSKPETEKTTTRLSSCKPEVTTSQLHPINFRTYDANLTDNSDFDKWETVANDWSNYRFFFIDCNGNIFVDLDNNDGFVAKSFDLDHIIDETNEDKQYFQIALRFEKMGIVKPFQNQAVLTALLSANGSN
jgi:hypothetical protein